MSFGPTRPLGLRIKLTLWSSLVLAASLAAGLIWVHYGLRRVLEARNDAFLERKAAELLASVSGESSSRLTELEDEIRREVVAYEPDGLVIVARRAGRALVVAPTTGLATRIGDRADPAGSAPATIDLGGSDGRYRALTARSREGELTLVLGISLAETESTLAAFDRLLGASAAVFLMVAVAGGLFVSRLAVRPVAHSIRAARRLDLENLSERLPQTGAGDELDELAGTINGLLDRLAAYHAQVIRFTADASHELRSPLGAMRAAVEITLQQPREPEEYRNVLASLGDQCERLTELVNALLLLARADAGEVVVERSRVDLAALASEVGEFFEPLADEKAVQLVTETPAPAIVMGDPSRLRQLVTNLVDNAIRFSQPGGAVGLRVEAAAVQVILRVSDTGIGISRCDLPHIFDRFYQANPSRSWGGHGLGLSICRWITTAHGGTIEAVSEESRGTVFTVRLPLAENWLPVEDAAPIDP